MHNLGSTAENELDPNVPAPRKELFNETAHYGTQDGTADRRKDDEGYSVLLGALKNLSV